MKTMLHRTSSNTNSSGSAEGNKGNIVNMLVVFEMHYFINFEMILKLGVTKNLTSLLLLVKFSVKTHC